MNCPIELRNSSDLFRKLPAAQISVQNRSANLFVCANLIHHDWRDGTRFSDKKFLPNDIKNVPDHARSH